MRVASYLKPIKAAKLEPGELMETLTDLFTEEEKAERERQQLEYICRANKPQAAKLMLHAVQEVKAERRRKQMEYMAQWRNKLQK